MACGNCGHKPCDCGNGEKPRPVWTPSTTVQRACELIHALLQSQGCEVKKCPDCHLCRLLKLECDLCGGRYPLAALAMMTAARLLESEAITLARTGNVKTLTISVNGNQSADVLREIAATWREQAEKCVPRQYFASVSAGRSCLQAQRAYNSCGCLATLTKTDVAPVSSCNFNCCDDGCD